MSNDVACTGSFSYTLVNDLARLLNVYRSYFLYKSGWFSHAHDPFLKTISGLLTNYLGRNLRALGNHYSKIGVVLNAHAHISAYIYVYTLRACARKRPKMCAASVMSKNEVNKEGSRVICNPVPTSLQAHRVTYDSRPFLVHLVFADLSSRFLTLGAHAQRGLVCPCVCLSVCRRLFWHYRLRGAYELYKRVQIYKGLKNYKAILLKRLRSGDMA